MDPDDLTWAVLQAKRKFEQAIFANPTMPFSDFVADPWPAEDPPEDDAIEVSFRIVGDNTPRGSIQREDRLLES
jgi:hypothetical protein